MPKKLFFELNEEKKARILQAGLTEFAQHSFNESSTNSIVKKAEISKGSLFKYFDNKEDFYFHILDYVIADLVEELKEEILDLPHDLFERVIKYSKLEFDWYIKNPNQYKLIKSAFADDNSEIYQKTAERYQLAGDSFYNKLFENVNFEQFNWDKESILNILKWFLKGFNEEFIKGIETDSSIDHVKDRYLKKLREYIEILKKGFYK